MRGTTISPTRTAGSLLGFRARDNATHYQALWTSCTSITFRHQHADVRYEVGGVGPDFRLPLRGERVIAGVEVLSLFQQQEWTDEQLRHLRLADAVCAAIAPTAGYFVDFHIEEADEDPTRRYIAHVRRELDSLPPTRGDRRATRGEGQP